MYYAMFGMKKQLTKVTSVFKCEKAYHPKVLSQVRIPCKRIKKTELPRGNSAWFAKLKPTG